MDSGTLVHIGDSYFGTNVMCARGSRALSHCTRVLEPRRTQPSLAGCVVRPRLRVLRVWLLSNASTEGCRRYVSVEPRDDSSFAVVVSSAATDAKELPAVLRTARDFWELHTALRSRILSHPLPHLPAKPEGLLGEALGGSMATPSGSRLEYAHKLQVGLLLRDCAAMCANALAFHSPPSSSGDPSTRSARCRLASGVPGRPRV